MGMNHVYIDTSDTFDTIVAALDDAGFHNVAQDLVDDPAHADSKDTWDLVTNHIVPLMEACGLETHVIDDELDTAYIVVAHQGVRHHA